MPLISLAAGRRLTPTRRSKPGFPRAPTPAPAGRASEMGVPALGYLCRQVVKENIDDLAYVGDFLYEEVDDLLLLVRRADQLAEIEENSPQIVEHDQAVWEKLVRKDFQVPHKRREKQHRAMHGEDSALPVDSWRDLHKQYKKEQGELRYSTTFNAIIPFANAYKQSEKLEAQSLQNLEASMAKHQAKSSNAATLVNPRSIPRLAASTGWRYSTSNSMFSRGFSSKNTNAVQKARREAQEARRQRKVAIASINPMGPGGLPPRKLKIAPRGLRDEVRIQRQPRIVPRRPPKPKPPSREEEERARREARLLAAKNPTTSSKRKQSDSPGEPAGAAKPAPLTTSKRAAPSKPVDSTSILFPNGSAASKAQQKVVIKTVPASSKAASGLKGKPASGQEALPTPPSTHPTLARPYSDRVRGQSGLPTRAAEARGAASSATPAKRPAVPSSGSVAGVTMEGARSPPPPRPRKKRKEDLIFAKPRR